MITNVTITFVNSKTINISNLRNAVANITINKFNSDGTFTLITDSLAVPALSDIDQALSDGFYHIFDTDAINEGITILMYGETLEHINEDVEELLVLGDTVAAIPHAYDFVSLALLSITFLGQTSYQNVSYNVLNATSYNTLATAINRCRIYMDNSSNTPQSKIDIWNQRSL
jgi:hypothetical protein